MKRPGLAGDSLAEDAGVTVDENAHTMNLAGLPSTKEKDMKAAKLSGAKVKEPTVGRFSVEFEVANNRDVIAAELGHLSPEKVRRLTISGVVDSGATRLILPADVVKQLGLPSAGRTKTRYADGRMGQREVVDEVRVTMQGRSRVFDAIVEPKRQTALIGAIVLETLDFVVDCIVQKLVPRDPKQIVSEIE
jgi:predicted aspartyl protease